MWTYVTLALAANQYHLEIGAHDNQVTIEASVYSLGHLTTESS